MVTVPLVLFYIVGALTIGGALAVVLSRNIVYAGFSLFIALLGVAGIFLLASAEFLALVQILIYGGAIIIVILFTLMLTRIQDFQHLSNNSHWPAAAFAAIVIFGLFLVSIALTTVRNIGTQVVDFESFSETLFIDWAIPFEIASLILLVALIGAVVMVRENGERND